MIIAIMYNYELIMETLFELVQDYSTAFRSSNLIVVYLLLNVNKLYKN